MTQSILITGATSGIGEALAFLAADSGWRVIACGRNTEKLATMSFHKNIDVIEFDVTDENATTTALHGIKWDIAVLNAGTCEYVDLDHFEPKMFKRVFEPNFFGVINTYHGLYSQLKSGNQVVIVDSLARLLPFSKSQAYGASKAALYYFSKSLEVDLANRGVIVQTVSPGFVDTPLTAKNEFDMPMSISVKTAAEFMLAAILTKRRSIYFPRAFSVLLRLLGLLPASIQKRIALHLKQPSDQQ